MSNHHFDSINSPSFPMLMTVYLLPPHRSMKSCNIHTHPHFAYTWNVDSSLVNRRLLKETCEKSHDTNMHFYFTKALKTNKQTNKTKIVKLSTVSEALDTHNHADMC